MLNRQTRGAILRLHKEGHSLRHISRLLSLSRDSVRAVVRIGSDEPPIIHRQRKLDAHRERIRQMLWEFGGNVVRVHRALADAGTTVGYRTLTAFCRNNQLFNRASDPKRSVAAAREWLTELVNGIQTVDRIQHQLSNSTDLQLLLSQLKHGRSRHRKKAATVLAKKRGISNSMIAQAIRSSRSTTRRYYNIYLEDGPEKLFNWSTIRKTGADHHCAERTKRVLEILHHKPTTFGINRTNWTRAALLKAYEHSFGETFPDALLPEFYAAPATDGGRHNESLRAPIPIITKRLSCCWIRCALSRRMTCSSFLMSGDPCMSENVEERPIETIIQRSLATKSLGALHR
jgi:hypothetical protein